VRCFKADLLLWGVTRLGTALGETRVYFVLLGTVLGSGLLGPHDEWEHVSDTWGGEASRQTLTNHTSSRR
jgi:hypothetical protein